LTIYKTLKGTVSEFLFGLSSFCRVENLEKKTICLSDAVLQLHFLSKGKCVLIPLSEILERGGAILFNEKDGTAVLPKWPRAEAVSYQEVFALSQALQKWYFYRAAWTINDDTCPRIDGAPTNEYSK
jgi:hypothetical protein